MKPYYERNGVTIYHGDCREVLPNLKADVVLTDPPYNSGLRYGDGTNDNRNDYWEWLGERVDLMLGMARTVVVKHSALKLGPFIERWPSRVLIWSKPFSSGFPLRGVATHWEPIHLIKGEAVAWSKDVFEYSAGKHRDPVTGHPAQFPEPVARWLVTTFSRPTDVILDPFMGSGTTVRAAADMGRRAIGIEIEERYCEIAARRLAQDVLPLEASA